MFNTSLIPKSMHLCIVENKTKKGIEYGLSNTAHFFVITVVWGQSEPSKMGEISTFAALRAFSGSLNIFLPESFQAL